MPGWCTTLSSNSDKRSRQRTCIREARDIIMSHSNASWSGLTVEQLCSKYRQRNKIDDTTARYSLYVAASFCSKLLSDGDQYPIGRSVLSSCFWSSTHATYVSQASVSLVCSLFARDRMSISVFAISFLRATTDCISAFYRVQNVFGSSLRSVLFKEASSTAYLGTNWRYTLQSRGKWGLSSAVVVFVRRILSPLSPTPFPVVLVE